MSTAKPVVPPSANGAARPNDADAAELLRLVHNNWITQAIAVAAELGLADLMARGVHRLHDLAQAAECHPASLRRLLRALTTFGLCLEADDHSFMLTPMGALLASDAPTSLRSLALWAGRHQWPAWGNILHCLKTGESGRTFPGGVGPFAHMERDPDTATVFHRAMTEGTRLIARAMIGVYDFAAFARIVDVGGGYGELLSAILHAYPNIQGTLLELPNVLKGAREHLQHAGVADRCALQAGDFFESIPGGADCYVLKSVIHDWNDERAAAILARCRAAMSRDARLLVVEQIMPERMDASVLHQDLARRDLTMLVMLGGKERTAAEYGRLLRAADLVVTRIIPAALNFAVIEAVCASNRRLAERLE